MIKHLRQLSEYNSIHENPSENQFLEQRSKTDEGCHQVKHQSDQKKYYKRGKPQLGRNKCVFLVDHNRPIRQILREMRLKQKQYQQKIASRQKLIREDKQYQKMASQFHLVERRVKNRLAIENKRFQRHKSRTIESDDRNLSTINVSSIQIDAKQCKGQRNQPVQQKQSVLPEILNPAGYLEKSSLLQNSQHIENKSTVMSKKKSKQSKKNQNKKYITQSDKSSSKSIVPLKIIKSKQRSNTLPIETKSHSYAKKIDYLKSMPKRHQSSLESQLEDLYNSQSQDIDKAVTLVDKIQQRRRLRKKNMEDKDFESVQSKLKLLNFIYRQ